mgnify:CR=1 FL=1
MASVTAFRYSFVRRVSRYYAHVYHVHVYYVRYYVYVYYAYVRYVFVTLERRVCAPRTCVCYMY